MSNIYKKLSVGNLMAMAVTLPMVANTTNTASSPLLPSAPDAQKASQTVKAGDVQILRINPTLVEIVFANQQRVAVDFYGESVFRIFEDHNDGVMRAPEAKPEASILVDNPRTALNHKQVKVEENDNSIILSTTKAQVIFDKATQLFKIINLENGKTVAEQSAPAQFTPEKVTLSLRQLPVVACLLHAVPSVAIINRYGKGQREVFALVVAKLRGKPIVLPFLREILIIVGRNAATERE